jgi:signal transduction histidine kinase
MPLEEHPSRRAMIEGDLAPHDVIVPLGNGQRRVISVRAARLTEGTDTIEGPAALLVYRDVTTERAESRRLAEFAEVTAHDLRSPLTTVVGWVSFASDELARPQPAVEEASALLEKALIGAGRLGELIDNMLDQALAEGAELHLEPLDLGGPDGLVAEIGEMLGVTDLVMRGSDSAVALADERAVRQLVGNLLGNAVKYRSPDRPLVVTVDIEPSGSRILVHVNDNGRGIPFEERERVFQRYNRVSATETLAGTGLGLSICQQIVERHGGVISCASGQNGIGTTFSFDLPANR